MNRRRILSSIHTSIARKASQVVAPVDHSTVERMSIADLDRIGPRLVPPPAEKQHCLYCGAELHEDAYFPFCGIQCCINAENS